MTTPNALVRRITELLRELLDRDLILLPSVMITDGRHVTWRSPTPSSGFVDFHEYPTIRTYRRWADSGEYAALMPDGSLMQISYQIDNGEIVGHRLAYVPCPYRVDQDLLVTEPVSDVLDLHADDSHDSITMQSTIRFDFDPSSAAEGHPSAHLTMNVSSCRIACESPMTPESFVRFVYSNFYRTLWSTHRQFFDGLPRPDIQSTVTEFERTEPHVAWRRPVAP